MKATEEHVEKNETIQGQFEACAEEAEEEDANDPQNYAGFDKELQELDTDDKEVHRGKFMRKEKNPRFDNIKKDKKQKEYKELHCEKFQRSTIKNTQKKHKRHNTIEISSEDEEWQPSEEEINITDDEEYSEKQGNQKNSSITKQITDSRKKHRFEPKHSKKKKTIENMKKNEIQPEQTTSNQSTFLMDVEYRKPKKHQGKKSTKSEDHPPPKKQKKKEEVEIEIPKHLFTVMAQTLREKQIDKSHVKPQKLEWAGTATERKRTSVIYHHIPENLKNFMWQNIELTEEEKVLVEGKIMKEMNGMFKCLHCNEKSFQKKREIYRHVRIVHSDASIMHVCGYDTCNIGNNNTTLL